MTSAATITLSAKVGPNGGTIYVADGNGNLIGVSATGALKWSRKVATSDESSPAIGPAGNIHAATSAGLFVIT